MKGIDWIDKALGEYKAAKIKTVVKLAAGIVTTGIGVGLIANSCLAGGACDEGTYLLNKLADVINKHAASGEAVK